MNYCKDISRVLKYDGLIFIKDKKCGYYLNKSLQIRLHRYIWVKKYGEIPEGHCVHHADGNKDNNDISNLTIMKRCDHAKHHGNNWTPERKIKAIANLNDQKEKAKAWHRSPEGYKWHREHALKVTARKIAESPLITLICTVCGKEYKTKLMYVAKSKYCHANCKAKALRLRRKNEINKSKVN